MKQADRRHQKRIRNSINAGHRLRARFIFANIYVVSKHYNYKIFSNPMFQQLSIYSYKFSLTNEKSLNVYFKQVEKKVTTVPTQVSIPYDTTKITSYSKYAWHWMMKKKLKMEGGCPVLKPYIIMFSLECYSSERVYNYVTTQNYFEKLTKSILNS